MATLVLSTVGQIVGGPIGGAVGAIVGQQIDGRIFAPKPRHGPRLGGLAVQTSSYGSEIPKIFGTMRVAGTVIWATDLKEHKASGGGGKGRPRTVEYSYSASFAVVLSGRAIERVGRVWADGKLLRGAAGDLKVEGEMRVHTGGEDQAADPLIASAEGAGQAPAYRGLAYAVFEDLALAEFGNRIPSLSFEVVAGPAPSVGAIAEALSDGEVAEVPGPGSGPVLAGYAAGGDSVRSAIAALADVLPLSLVDTGGRMRLGAAAGTAAADLLARAAAGARRGDTGGATEIVRAAAAAMPAEVSIAYYDVARDHQTGLQRASRGGGGLRGDRRALPAALDAGLAKALAEQRLAAAWAARARARVHLPWHRAGLRPGDRLRLEGAPGLWRVERWTLEHMVVSLDLCGVPGRPLAGPAAAAPGRPVGEADLVHGPTTVLLLDLPGAAGDAPTARPALYAAAAGQEAGWRGAQLSASFDGGTSWQPAGRTAAPAAIGTLVSAPAAAGPAVLDLAGAFEIEMLNAEMWLEGRSDAALAAGANLAAAGDELIQFGSAEPLGGGRFRLSRLLRGRRGTEWAAAHHGPGQWFVLLDPAALAPLDAPAASIGGEARLLAAGPGDPPGGAAAARPIGGEALRPPSPVHLRAARAAGGTIEIGWVRRSRSGWDWQSSAETPLGEEREGYRLSLTAAGGARTVEVAEPRYAYSADEQAADGFAGTLEVEVVQLGTAAPSRPARRTFAGL